LAKLKIYARVFDGNHGKPAAGVWTHLARAIGNVWQTVAAATTNDDGRVEEWDNKQLESGLYRIAFGTDTYFAEIGARTAYPEIVVTFRTDDESRAFQLQVTIAPYSYSTYFGAAEVRPRGFRPEAPTDKAAGRTN
jgi:5-hydroxyisourate hydrolase